MKTIDIDIPSDTLATTVGLLVRRGRLALPELRRAAAQARQIQAIEARLATLRAEERGESLSGFVMTPTMRRVRRVQGQYIGRLKKFPAGPVRAEAKRLAKAEGVPAAIRFLDKKLKG